MEVLKAGGKCETLTGPIKHCATATMLSETTLTYLWEMSSVHEAGFGVFFINNYVFPPTTQYPSNLVGPYLICRGKAEVSRFTEGRKKSHLLKENIFLLF